MSFPLVVRANGITTYPVPEGADLSSNYEVEGDRHQVVGENADHTRSSHRIGDELADQALT